MIKKLNGEIWKPLKFKGWQSMRNKYAVSSHGRAASYNEDIPNDGKLLSGSLTSGYRTLNLRLDGKSKTLYLHREVAKLFNDKSSPKQKYVIHINHVKADNRAKNLKWATQIEVNVHQQKSPKKLEYKKVQGNRKKGLKLNSTQVKAIKSILANPRRKLTHQQIADKYNISPMTVYRIKSGENWADV
ncbi:MAG: HNH endonuclease [Ginsengibacter sp.]